MNIDLVKKKIVELKNQKLKIKVSLGRNKYEYFEGYIDKVFPNIFTIKTENNIKSFSYSDVAIKSVTLSEFT